MNNYAYVTLISSDIYLEFLYSWILYYKLCKSKYPAHVIITDNCDLEAVRICKQNEINYTIVPLKLYKGEVYIPRYASTWNKFYIWGLILYKKILYIDLDSTFQNCDAILENDDIALPHFHLRITVNHEGLGKPNIYNLAGAAFIIEPNLEEYHLLLDDSNAKYANDEHQLNDYYLMKYFNNHIYFTNGRVNDAFFELEPYIHKLFHSDAARRADEYFEKLIDNI